MLTSRRRFIEALSVGTATALLPATTFASIGKADPVKRIILDSDTATDDALAVLMAVTSPRLKVEAITITCGNVGFDQQTKNALYTIQLAGKNGQIPVYQGSARPLVRQVHGNATYVHGSDGMSDSFFPDPQQKPEKEHAVDAIIRLVDKYPNEITIVAIGPLTNVALALLRDPSIAKKVKELYFMGGFYKFYGNINPGATYNAWVDPEAARVVFQSGIPITTVGFDVSVKSSVFTDDDYAKVEKLGTKYADFFMKINRIRRKYCKEHQKMNGSNHPDAITIAAVIDPSIVSQSVSRFVDIETRGELTLGALAIDELGVWGKPPNATICVEADEAKFKKMVFDTLKMS
ncbi:nucleoside hydrolase [Spirosoma aureum]|uniref:Nucleoside hydrolase n=1 Tax=Spirosoma aureum TaxID=2692134 RepID=A0A6G9AJY6_9BACT|nr:nucleoside hydrolase [Spirosoma aureum]QIP12777.1 nucleoside hydrolase [Spirosoma aureum]